MSNKLDKEHLVPGAIVMVGPSERSGRKDYSWTDAIWRVEAGTGDAILCRRVSRLDNHGSVIFMRYSEHSRWQAEHILEAYKAAVEETKAEYAAQVAERREYDNKLYQRADSILNNAVRVVV